MTVALVICSQILAYHVSEVPVDVNQLLIYVAAHVTAYCLGMGIFANSSFISASDPTPM